MAVVMIGEVSAKLKGTSKSAHALSHHPKGDFHGELYSYLISEIYC